LQGQVVELGHGSSPEATDTIPVYGIKLPAWRDFPCDLVKPCGEGLASNFMCTHGAQMSGVLLTVDPFDVVLNAKTHQGGKCQLGAIWNAGEHGFAKYSPSNVEAVQARLQLAIDPGLHTVSDAHPVQLNIRLDHVFGDPGTLLLGARALGASSHDGLKLGIESDLEMTLCTQPCQRLPQATSHPEAMGRQHHAWVGAPPKNRLPIAEPRKYAVPVGLNQGGRTQVCAGGQQAR